MIYAVGKSQTLRARFRFASDRREHYQYGPDAAAAVVQCARPFDSYPRTADGGAPRYNTSGNNNYTAAPNYYYYCYIDER